MVVALNVVPVELPGIHVYVILVRVEVFTTVIFTEGLLHVKVAVPVVVKENEVAAVPPTVKVVLVVQPLASTTVTVLVPGLNPEAIEPLLKKESVDPKPHAAASGQHRHDN